MQAFQAHYTSCKRGRSGSAGQQFRSVTPGLGDDALGFIQGRVGIVLPAGLPPTPTDEERRAFPVTLRHELLPDGRPMLLRVAWSGRDWAGRWGNEFGHAMVFPVAPPLWPVDLARWEGWIGELSPDADTLDDPPDLDPLEVERAAGEALLTVPGFIAYLTRTQLQYGWVPPTEGARAVARSYYPPRCGDLVAVQAPFSYWGKYGEKDYGGSHGSFYRYDTDVPLLFAGAPFKKGRFGQAEMVDLAATLAHVLGIAPPAACEGTPIGRILKGGE